MLFFVTYIKHTQKNKKNKKNDTCYKTHSEKLISSQKKRFYKRMFCTVNILFLFSLAALLCIEAYKYVLETHCLQYRC